MPMESGPFVPEIGNLSHRKIVLNSSISKKDLSETTDHAATHPKVVSELTAKYNVWLDEMADPVSRQEKRWNPDAGAPASRKSKEAKKVAREKAKAARIKERESKKRRPNAESS